MSKHINPMDLNPDDLNLSAELKHTLAVCISCGMNYTHAAKKLDITRSGVKRRLESIERKLDLVFKVVKVLPSPNPKISYDRYLAIVKLKTIYDLSNREIAAELSVSHSTLVKIFNNHKVYHGFAEQAKKDGIGGTRTQPTDREIPHNGKKVIFITAAQNNTHIHDGFLAAIKQFMQHRDADFKVITFTYSHSMMERSEKGDGWYDAKIRDYIEDNVIRLSDDLVLHSNLNILPTAVNPLSSLEGFCKKRSGIFAHVKQEMDSIAQAKDSEPGLMYTTGAITHMHYRQKKAGQKAEFDHIIGGLVVELEPDGSWFVRQVNAETDTGNFYDWDTYYTKDGWTTGHKIAGLNPGDIHTQQLHPLIAEATLGVTVDKLSQGMMYFTTSSKPSLITELEPEYLFCHDICDFKVRNHHEINNFHSRYRQFIEQEESIQIEINNVGDLLKAMEGHKRVTPVVVNSNHDRAIMRYLLDNVSQWHHDPINAEFFLETHLAIIRGMRNGIDIDPLEWAIKNRHKDLAAIFLREDQPFEIVGIDCSRHGDRGPGGSRGSIKGFVKTGIKMNIGHSHVASIKSGVFQAGITCRKDLAYAKGPSAWSWSHIVTYANGKRTMVTMRIVDDVVKYRGQR